ncbi:MAG: peptidoglycan DD-metalloendopeptidase family protein [Candidatus Aenigmarchaeota archaeon]|nr:peptidoglycan DD-metalloendopeptidase family protein [Candidatus Aenigmarchaeota archaeon]
MSRYKKGFVGLWVIIIAMAFVIFGMHLFAKTHIITKIFKIKGEVDIYIEIDERATEGLTFLGSRLNEKDYMEILGSLIAKDSDKILKGDLEKIGNTLSELENYYLIVKDSSGNTVYEKKKGDPSKAARIYKLGSINLDWPVRGTPVISSGFGLRMEEGSLKLHGGIDIALPEGTEVYPAADGQVVEIVGGCAAAPASCKIIDDTTSDPDKRYNHRQCGCNGGLGNYVTLKHHQSGQTFYTFYVHLKDVVTGLKKGDKVVVASNRHIGLVGNTGYSKGTHLHFELGTAEKKSDATAVDPCPYLPNAPVECEQPSHRVTGYGIDIPLPGGKKGKVEMVIWE